MPVGSLLKAVADVQQASFVKVVADQLQAHRQAVDQAGRQRHAG